MKSWSIKGRLTAAITVIILLAFYSIYWVTKSAYTHASKARIQESLTAQIYSLMAVAQDMDAQLTLPPMLRNDRLNHLNSGLVAYVLDVDGDLIWRSKSSDTYATLPDIYLEYSLSKMTEAPLDGNDMFWIGDQIFWEHENGMEGEYLFLIGEEQSILLEQVGAYKRQVAIWLWVTTFVIIFVLLGAMYLSLKPLQLAQRQIELIRAGDADKIEGRFPKELVPLTSSINAFLESELLQKKRYRDSLGNLAHSLKTPLSIIKSELADNEDNQQILKQVERIDDIVRYQLNRSVVTAGHTLKRKCLVEPYVYKIIDALNKVHADKNLSILSQLEDDAIFPGEPGDLMELIGNLADNACKWAKQKIIISVSNQLTDLYISVDDDGSGVPEEKRSLILDRGKRLDQQAEGQGLGLSIVMDIIKTYHGELTISESDVGGARFKIRMPI